MRIVTGTDGGDKKEEEGPKRLQFGPLSPSLSLSPSSKAEDLNLHLAPRTQKKKRRGRETIPTY